VAVYYYFVRVLDRTSGEVLETLEFENRQQLGLFFESATFEYVYKVSRAAG
jgi:hypothetical protein